MADDLDQMIKDNKIPDNPDVIAAIKADTTGKLLEQVQSRHQALIAGSPLPPQTIAGAAPQPAPPSVQEVFPKPRATEPPPPEDAFMGGSSAGSVLGGKSKSPYREDVLQSLIQQDKIPNDDKVLTAIRRGEVPLMRVLQKHAEFRDANPIGSVEPGGKVNAHETLKLDAVDKGTIGNIWDDFMEYSAKKFQSEMIPKSTSETIGTILSHANPVLSGTDIFSPSKLADSMAYRGRSLVSGLTFGVLPNETEPPTPTDEMMGYVANLTGTFLTGEGIAKVAGKIPFVAKMDAYTAKLGADLNELKTARAALEGTGEGGEAWLKLGSEIWKKGATKLGVNLAKVGGESAVTGFVAGTAQGLISGKDTVGALSDGMATSLLFTGFGMAMLPIAEAAGSLFGLGQTQRTMKVAGAIGGFANKTGLAEETAKAIPEISAQFNKEIAGPLSPRQLLIQDGLERIKATEPLIGMKAAVLSHPELMMDALNGNIEAVSTAIFGPGGPLEALPKMNPRLNILLSEGKHAEALDAAQSSLTDVITANRDTLDYTMAPFTQSAQTMNKIYAERLMNSVNYPERYPDLKANILNYLDNPSAENQLLVSGKNAPRGFVNKFSKNDFFDRRLSTQEVDTAVGDLFSNALKTLAGPEHAQSFGDRIANKIIDAEAILKTGITFNKELNRSFISAFQENPYSWNENFIKARPDLQQPIEHSINAQRIMAERDVTLTKRRQLTGAIQDLTDKLRQTTDPAESQRLQALLGSTQDKRKTLTAVLGLQNKNLREIETMMGSLSPQTRQEVNDFVSKAYIPKRSGEDFGKVLEKRMEVEPQINKLRPMLTDDAVSSADKDLISSDIQALRNKYRPQIQSSPAYMAKFGEDANPKYIRAGSELADAMNAFVTANQDFKKGVGSTFSMPFIANIENPRRSIAKELGPNNVFEKALNQVKAMDTSIAIQTNKWVKFINDLGIKPRSEDSALLQRLGEKRLSRTDPEFLALSPERQQKLIDALPKTRHFYDTMIDSINEVHAQNNFPLIKKRDDYFLHFGETMEGLPNQMIKFLQGDTSETIGGKGVQMFWKKSTAFDPNRTHFGSEKARKGGEFTDDAITGMQAYLRPALERVYYSDMVRELDTARHFAPQNMGEFIQNIKENYLLKSPNQIDKMTSQGLKGTVNVIRSRLGRGAILFNVNTAAQQLLSIPQNFAIGPTYAIKALMHMHTRDGEEASNLSRSLAKRDVLQMDIDKEAKIFTKGVVGALGIKPQTMEKISGATDTAAKYWQNFGGWAMQTFDKVAAKHAYLTGYYKAIGSGASREEAALLGDRWLEMVQNDMSRISQPKFYQSTLGRSLTQFTSFTTNFAATIMNDLPNIAKRDGGAAAVSMIVKSVAGMSIANETARQAGIPAPFDLDTFIPFLGSYRFGAPGMASIVPNIAIALTGEGAEQAAAVKKLERTGAAMAISGGGQFYKTADAFLDSSGEPRDKASKAGFAKDAIFGRGRNKIELKRKQNPDLYQRTRSSLSGKIRKKVFGR